MTRPGNDGASRRTVLHVIDTMLYAGAQRYVALLCRWSDPSRFRHLVCVLQPRAELKAEVEKTGARMVCLDRPRPSILRPWKLARYIRRNIRDIARLCRSEGVDVVQCHLSDAEFLGIAAAALCRVPVIISTLHGPLPLLPPRSGWSPRNTLRRFTTRLLYGLTSYVVAVSDEVAAEAARLFSVPRGKLVTVINRIDTDSYTEPVDTASVRASLGLGPEHKVITTTARLEPHKGQAVLVSALHLLGEAHPEARLLLLGEGESRPSLEDQCRSLGVADRVLFLGARGDVRDILAASDIFAFPSFAEGTSLALMEAMAAGAAIAATDIPGNRTLLEHGKNALLVPPGDSPALAGALRKLIEQPETAGALSREARAFVRKNFDIRGTVAELERLWNS